MLQEKNATLVLVLIEKIYLLIATINKCDLGRGRKGRVYFLLAFKTRFTSGRRNPLMYEGGGPPMR